MVKRVALLILALVGFVTLAVLGSSPYALAANLAVARWVDESFPLSLFEPMTASLLFGSTTVTIVGVIGVAAYLYSRGHYLAALSLGLLFVGIAVEIALKASLHHPDVWDELYHRTRFYPLPEFDASMLPSGVSPRSPFPSGHIFRVTFVALTLPGLLAWRLGPTLTRLARVVGWLVILSAGLSIIILGWHWASDVFGGLLLGYALASIASLAAPSATRP